MINSGNCECTEPLQISILLGYERMQKMIPQQEILLLAIKAGQIQLENGAEIFRVEDTIMHICHSYGLHSVNTFVLSNGIFISCGDEQEPQFAKVLQVPVNHTNLRRVAEVNQLSRRIEKE